MKACPYCAEEIQDAAIVCKHCGRELTAPVANQQPPAPPKPPQSKAALGCAVILLLVMGSCVVAMLLPESEEQRLNRELSNARAVTATLCEAAVSRQLTSPGTADFPFGHVSTVTQISPGRYQLSSYVDSQNAFGATLRTRFRCIVQGSGEELSGYRVADVELIE